MHALLAIFALQFGVPAGATPADSAFVRETLRRGLTQLEQVSADWSPAHLYPRYAHQLRVWGMPQIADDVERRIRSAETAVTPAVEIPRTLERTPFVMLEDARVLFEKGEPAAARSLADSLLRDPKLPSGLRSFALEYRGTAADSAVARVVRDSLHAAQRKANPYEERLYVWMTARERLDSSIQQRARDSLTVQAQELGLSE